MSTSSAVLRLTGPGYTFWCPGCNRPHFYWTHQSGAKTGPVWHFNGNVESPSFEPSLLNRTDAPTDQCHLWITDGQIKFFDDCGHSLAGQTVPMVPFPQSWD